MEEISSKTASQDQSLIEILVVGMHCSTAYTATLNTLLICNSVK